MTTTPEFPYADRLPPQAQEFVVKAEKNFQLRKEHVILAVATVVLYKVEKRMVTKVVTKALKKEVPQIVSNELVGLALTDKFGVIGTIAKQAAA